MSKFIFMVKSVNDTPNDREDKSLLLGAIRLVTVSPELVQHFASQGWWEGDADLYEQITGFLAEDLDGDGDVDATDEALAEAIVSEQEDLNASHAEDEAAGRVA